MYTLLAPLPSILSIDTVLLDRVRLTTTTLTKTQSLTTTTSLRFTQAAASPRSTSSRHFNQVRTDASCWLVEDEEAGYGLWMDGLVTSQDQHSSWP